MNKFNKDAIIVFSTAIIILATVFFRAFSPTGKVTTSASKFSEPTAYFNLILVGGVIVIIVLWYYLKKVKEIEKGDFSG